MNRPTLIRIPRPKRLSCCFPGCRRSSETGHHVVYPGRALPICHVHHRQITLINRQEAVRRARRLSDQERGLLFGQWKRGKRKAAWTNANRQWLNRYWRPYVPSKQRPQRH
jgi:hypothetical protein